MFPLHSTNTMTHPTPYFRCRSKDRALEIRRLQGEAERVLAALEPSSVVVRRLPSREQSKPSQETEIAVHTACRVDRIRLPKPASAIDIDDLQKVLLQLKPILQQRRS